MQVKLLFESADGSTEGMWVAVLRRTGDTIDRLLDNESFQILNLLAGQRVRRGIADVLD